MTRATQASSSPSAEGSVLTKALLASGRRLGLSRKALAEAVGVSPASMSRLQQGRQLDPASKPGELALLVVRMFRSLDALTGGDEEAARTWLRSENDHLGGVPAEMIGSVGGLVRVVEYLDAMRGKL